MITLVARAEHQTQQIAQPSGASSWLYGKLRPRPRRLLLPVALTTALLTLLLLSAVPALADETCANESARLVQNATGLPDCRAYELVSPVQKNGGDVSGAPDKTRAASDGNAVGFSSLQAFGDATGAGISVDYIAQRTAIAGTSGWSTHAITPPQEPQSFGFAIAGGLQNPFYVGEFSDDLSKGVFRALSPLSDAPNVASTRNLYLRSDLLSAGAGTYQLLTDATSPIPALGVAPNTIAYKPWFASASTDFSHILFESGLDLTPDAVGNMTKLYEWVNGSTRLAAVLPDGSPAMCDPGDTCAVAGQGATVRTYTSSAISADGSKVFFATPTAAGGGVISTSHLYLRDDHATASTTDDTTEQIDASEKTPPDPPGGAKFWAASADGTKVFFTSSEQLTNDPTGSGVNLYLYDSTKPASQHLTLISTDGDPSDGADVSGVLGISNDAQSAYFLAPDKLIAGQPTAPSGATYIYHWQHDMPLHYVGALTNSTDLDPVLGNNYTYTPKTSRVSGDGNVLAFVASSGDGLTGYPHATGCTSSPAFTAASQSPCSEMYIYDATANAGAGQMTCVSCLTGGALPGVQAGPDLKIGDTVGFTTHQNHFLSADGRYVFFSTASPLLPADKNRIADVYEYDTTTQQLHLLSSGTGTAGSYFEDATPNGSNVFFITRDRLLPWDQDNNYDLYDARINGGFPEPPAPAGECSGDACQGAATPPTPPPSSASNQLSGSGNLAPPAPPAAAVKPQVVKPLTRAQKLAKAFKACHKKPRVQRRRCEAQARKHYGAKPAKKSAAAHR